MQIENIIARTSVSALLEGSKSKTQDVVDSKAEEEPKTPAIDYDEEQYDIGLSQIWIGLVD